MENEHVMDDVNKGNSLEEKADFFDRLKYVSIPLALTAGSYFTPELRAKYDSLPLEERKKYNTIVLAGGFILGSVITASTAYKLFKNYKERDK
jgi:hypothetical protein